jgi:hypothetical protein
MDSSMNLDGIYTWQQSVDIRDMTMAIFAALAGAGLVVWWAWGHKTPSRRRLMVTGWILLELTLLGVGLWARSGM